MARAIVIGSGFGGLAAAARLGARGYDVTVLEKLDAPGGRAYVYRQDGYTFDAGPTIITAPYLFEELWQACGRSLADDVTLRALDPFYEVRFHDGDVFRYTADLAAMREQIARIEPRDVAGFDRFLEVSKEIYRVAFVGQAEQPFHELATLFKAAPDLLRLGGYRSVYSEVSRYFRSDKLRILFSFHPLLIGGNPFAVTCAYALINSLERTWGVHSAMGGTGAIVKGLVGLLQERGVPLRCNAPVTQIRIENGRACGADPVEHIQSHQLIEECMLAANEAVARVLRHRMKPSIYRIHGTNEPSSIGKAASSGCIRMLNEDVSELYRYVKIGARVTVL